MSPSIHYKIHYFNLRGRTEVIRLLLHLSGEKWENEYPKSWPSSKSEQPFGQLPVLEEIDEDNGKIFKLAQSKAIERYLANKYGFAGESDQETAYLESIDEHAKEFFSVIVNFLRTSDLETRDKLRQDFYEKTVPEFISIHEKLLGDNGSNGHYLGDKMTWVDLQLYILIDRINFDKAGTITMERAPRMWRVYESVGRDTRVKEYLESATRPPMVM